MNNMLKKIIGSPWFLPGLVLVGFVVVTKGRIVSAVAPMGRFLLPALVVYLVYRLVRSSIQKKFGALAKQFQQELMRQQQVQYQRQTNGAANPMRKSGPVIEICPTCGEQKSSRCSKH